MASDRANHARMDQVDPAEALAGVLVPRMAGRGPLYERLSAALRDTLAAGHPEPGARLPAERELARALGVSRGTVVAAYSELEGEGLLERRQGSGTRVAGRAPRGTPPLRARAIGIDDPRGRAAPGLIDLSIAAHAPPQELAEAIAGLDAAALAEAGAGYLPTGLPSLRSAIRRHLGRWDVPCEDDELIVTSGAHQAVALTIALHVRPGDAVAVEDPCYVGALDILGALRARAIPMAMDEAGLRPDALRQAVRRHGARLALVTPSGHNPTGTVMPARRRAEIARALAELDVPAIEDGTLHDLVLRATRPPMLSAFEPRAPIVTVGSLSKLFWGGLRIGWARAAADVVERLGRMKLAADHGSSALSQLVAARLLEEAEDARARVRRRIEERSRAVLETMADLLPDWSARAPQGGLCIWARMPAPEAVGVSRLARAMGVGVVPGPLASAEAAWTDHVRIALAHEPDVMREAVARLAAAWRAHVPAAPRAGGRLAAVV
jgi:DNA-binding transcriptional MocR family regulator